MSFESGFNAGLNLTASLRANAARAADRAQRGEQFGQAQEFREETFEYSKERDAAQDEMATKELQLREDTARLHASKARQSMEMEKAVMDRAVQDRAKSQVEFQAFAEKTQGLDMTTTEGRKAYNEALSMHVPGITDPNTMRSFNTYNDLRMQGAASHFGTIFQAQKASQMADLAEASVAFENDVKRAPESPEELSTWRSYQEVAKRIDDQDISWGMIEVEGLTRGDWTSMTPEIAAQAKAQIEDIEAERSKSDMTQTQVDTLTNLARASDQMANLENAAENLKIPTGKAFGPFLGKMQKLLGDDVNISNFESTLQGLIPGLARGFFGEVGVLTDQDIENYKKVIASLDKTPEANRVVMAATQALVNKAMIRTVDRYESLGKRMGDYTAMREAARQRPIAFYGDVSTAMEQIQRDLTEGRVEKDSFVSVYSPTYKSVTSKRVSEILKYAQQ